MDFCRIHPRGHSDAAKRISDTYNMHRTATDTLGINSIGKWFAAALHDGDSDGVLYDSKPEAVRHQKHNEHFYSFIAIGPHGMSHCDAEIMLSVSRRAYDAGFRLADPDSRTGGRDIIRRTTTEDMLALSRGRSQNVTLYIPEMR